MSPAWAEAAVRAVETDARIREAVRGQKVSLLTVVEDPPPGRYAYIFAAFDEGGLADYRVGHDASALDAMPKPTFTLRGPYRVYADLKEGKTNGRDAVLSGQLKLEGGMLRAMRHMQAIEAITGALANIPCHV